MTIHRTRAEIDAFGAPWGKTVRLREIEYDGGMVMLQVQIREGRRITLMDLDAATAARLGDALKAWAAAGPQATESPG